MHFWLVGWLVGFHGILTFVGYLIHFYEMWIFFIFCAFCRSSRQRCQNERNWLISIEIGPHKTSQKNLTKSLQELDIRGKIELIQLTAIG